jgi:hypothetical protein
MTRLSQLSLAAVVAWAAPGAAEPVAGAGLYARLASLGGELAAPPAIGDDPGARGLRLAQCYEAYYCATPWGECDLGELLCVGEPCYCPTFNGPVWGIACDDEGCFP